MNISLLLMFSFLASSCSVDDAEYITINGKVERSINQDGIENQLVKVMTRKTFGSGWFSYTRVLDSTVVRTDVNGLFSVNLLNDLNAYATVVYHGDDDYLGSGIFRNYPIDEPIIIKTDKFIKFKIFVNNTNPFDENDFIKIDFFAPPSSNVKRTNIENFGIENTHYPAEPLPGGGSIGPYEEASWTGTNVNSIVYYSAPESAQSFKIRWYKNKNGFQTDGFTDDIPYNINLVNSFSFEY